MIGRRTLAALAVLAVACQAKPSTDSVPAPLVRTVVVEKGTAEPLELRASVAPRGRVRLGFKLPGVVEEIHVAEAERVAKGQVLARLSDVDARAAVRAARAGRDKARRDAERATRLAGEGALATSARDDARSQLEAAEAGLAQAEDALERTVLRSPVAGTVFLRTAEPGEMLGAGSPVVVLDTTSDLELTSGAALREIRRLRVGQPALLLPEGGGEAKGRVRSLAATPGADGLYAVTVAPDPASAGSLRPGALVRLRFEAVADGASHRIPLEALVHRQDRDYVFVVTGQPGAAQVRLRPVELGSAEGDAVTVRSGLAESERVVSEGAYFLQDGQAVRVLD